MHQVGDRAAYIILFLAYICAVLAMARVLKPVLSTLVGFPAGWERERNYLFRNFYYDFRWFVVWLVFALIDPSPILSAVSGRELPGAMHAYFLTFVIVFVVGCLVVSGILESVRLLAKRRRAPHD